MYEYHNSYILIKILKEIESREIDKISEIKNIMEFINDNEDYDKFSNFNHIKNLAKSLMSIEEEYIIKLQELKKYIPKLISDIEYENHKYIKDYDYIESKIRHIVYKVNNEIEETKNKECVIFYEQAPRELQNAYLIKAELNRRGYDVYIYDLDYILKMDKPFNFTPDILLIPYLYEGNLVKIFMSKFKNEVPILINLQYEQVLSKNWENVGYHNPKGIARNAIHICWGQNSKNRLIYSGVPKENAIITGSINVDMDMERFGEIYIDKAIMAKRFSLDASKKWILYISSFSVTKESDVTIKLLNSIMGGKKTDEFSYVSEETREITLNWIEKYIKENDCEFIYRLHPTESCSKQLLDLNNKYKNFHILCIDSVRSWIKVCDKVNTWISTSVVDAYFMNKNCSIVRPVKMPENLDITIMKNARYITNYDEFWNYNNSIDKSYKFPIKEEEILEYYDIDKNKYSYERICDLIEDLIQNNIKIDL